MAELTTGKPLFPGESDLRTLQCILSTVGGKLTDKQKSILRNNPLFINMKEVIDDCCYTNNPNMIEKDFPVEIRGILRKCLEIDPELRPTCDNLLGDEYFSEDIPIFEQELKELIRKEFINFQMKMKVCSPSENQLPLKSIAEDKGEITNKNSDDENDDEEEPIDGLIESRVMRNAGGKLNKVTITFPKSQYIKHTGSSSELNTSFTKKSTKVPPGGGAALSTILFKEQKNPLKSINSKRNFRDEDFQNPPLFLKEEHSTKYNPKHDLLRLKGKNVLPSQVTSYPVANRLLALPQIVENKQSEKPYLLQGQFSKKHQGDTSFDYGMKDEYGKQLNDSIEEDVNTSLFKTSAINDKKDKGSLLPSIQPRHLTKAVNVI